MIYKRELRLMRKLRKEGSIKIGEINKDMDKLSWFIDGTFCIINMRHRMCVSRYLGGNVLSVVVDWNPEEKSRINTAKAIKLARKLIRDNDAP